MSDELASILTGETTTKPKAPKASSRKAKTYDPLDAAVRTVIAEEADPEARRWVAGVIANRAKAKGGDLLGVVQEPGQFEPWANGGKRIAEIDPNSPEYKAVAAIVAPILRGEAPDPTGGATQFYAPEAQKALAAKDGRPEKAEFDDGTGVQVGKTLFFRKGGGGTPNAELAGMFGYDDKADAAAKAKFKDIFGDPGRFEPGAELTGAGLTPYRGLKGETITEGQQRLYEAINKGGSYKPDAEAGTADNPFFVQKGTREKDVPAGAYYVDRTGAFKRAGGGEEIGGSFLKGVSRGVGDVMLSAAELAPGTEDSVLRNRMTVDQAKYDADLKGDLGTDAGRFTGQIAASVPLMVGGEAALAPVAARMGGVGSFLAGSAGKGALAADAPMAARMGQLALRGGSLSASGAGEGAVGSALLSSASDEPLQDQMLMGAMAGGVLKPVAGAVETGMRRFMGPSMKGAAPADAQAELAARSAGLPVEIPLDAGQLSRAPAAQAQIDDMLRGASGDTAAGVVQGFRATQQGAIRQNVDVISRGISGADAAPGEGSKAVSDALNKRKDAMTKVINKSYDDARARGDNAMLATGRDIRDATLESLRSRYSLDRVKAVAGEIENIGQGGAPTVRELYDTRERLTALTQSSDSVEAGAAGVAKRGLDEYIKLALKDDLFLGDPTAVAAWKKAISQRADLGKLFEGDDLIAALTTKARHGESSALKVDPEEAVNYIFGKSALGFVGKKDLGRDLVRLRGVLGKDSAEWNGLRAEAFMRVAKAGEGPPEAGVPQFSGQNFMKAWGKAWRDDPRVMGTLFTPYERKIIDDFAEVAQVATTNVKGGANTSNSAIALKRMGDRVLNFLSVGGGAGGGAAAGGPAGAAVGAAFGSLLKDLREVLAAGKARKLTYGARPSTKDAGLNNKLLSGPTAATAGAATSNRILGDREPVAEPQ